MPSIARRATELLVSRLTPGNRGSVVTALPFIVRMLGRRRRDHRSLSDAVGRVLLSDGGRHALDQVKTFDTNVRRYVYELVVNAATTTGSEGLSVALADADAVVRRVAVRRLAMTEDAELTVRTLERMLNDDPVPSVRRETVSILARRDPDRLCRLLPAVLLDRSATVRGLARYFVGAPRAPLVARDVYIDALNASSPARVKAAIDGLGELGSPADLHLVTRFASAPVPGFRGASIRAAARLNADEGVPLAVAALADQSPSVRATAIGVLRANASRVDFAAVADFIKMTTAGDIRERLLPMV